MGILIRCHSAKYRSQSGTTFPVCFCSLPLNPRMEIMPTVSRTDSQCTNKQVHAENLKSYSRDPRQLARKKWEERHAGYLSFHLEMLLLRRAGAGSVRAFLGTRRAPVEEARSRAVCSFGTSKPIHLTMWPLPFWLPHCALDSPVLFKRKALLAWGPLRCIPWSAVSQKMCPSWLCSVIIVPTVISVPIGWVR